MSFKGAFLRKCLSKEISNQTYIVVSTMWTRGFIFAPPSSPSMQYLIVIIIIPSSHEHLHQSLSSPLVSLLETISFEAYYQYAITQVPALFWYSGLLILANACQEHDNDHDYHDNYHGHNNYDHHNHGDCHEAILINGYY